MEEPWTYIIKWKKSIWEGYIPTIWHSGKGKTMEAVNNWVVTQGYEGRKDEQAEDRRILGHWHYSAWYYNDEHIHYIHLSKPMKCKTPQWILI